MRLSQKSPGSGVVEGVDEEKRHSASSTTRGNVRTKLGALASTLGDSEGGLDGVLEGKVEGLGGEVTKHIGEIS